MEIEREAMRKTSVQDFQWDGTEPRIDGKHVWFRSIDGSEHGWPQHTEFEAMRLAMFLHGAIAAALTAERAKFAAFADEKGEPRKVLGEKPSVFDALRRFVSLAERLDDYAMGGNSVRDTLPNLVAEMNDAANHARLHL